MSSAEHVKTWLIQRSKEVFKYIIDEKFFDIPDEEREKHLEALASRFIECVKFVQFNNPNMKRSSTLIYQFAPEKFTNYTFSL